MNQNIKNIVQSSIDAKTRLVNDETVIDAIADVTRTMVKAFESGHSVYFCGNGGSAADAQHISAELSGRFYFDRQPLPSEALHVNTSYLTAVGNDYGYDLVYSRAVRAFGKPGDVLVGLTTSGNSRNVVNALEQAQKQDMITVGFCGEKGGQIETFSDILIKVPSTDTPRIQEMHLMTGHIICQLIEELMFKK